MATYVHGQRQGNVTCFVRITEVEEWQIAPVRLSERHSITCFVGEGDFFIPDKIFYIDKNDEIREFDVSSSGPAALMELLLELE